MQPGAITRGGARGRREPEALRSFCCSGPLEGGSARCGQMFVSSTIQRVVAGATERCRCFSVAGILTAIEAARAFAAGPSSC